MGTVIGIDLGEVRVGVAASDPEGKVALPLTLLDGRDEKALIASIASLAEEREAAEIVVGLPRNMDGSYGPRAEAARRFRDLLAESVPIAVAMWDERLTSVQAERAIRTVEGKESRKGGRVKRRGGAPPAKGEKGRIDRVAAVLILQSYLDSKRGNRGVEQS